MNEETPKSRIEHLFALDAAAAGDYLGGTPKHPRYIEIPVTAEEDEAFEEIEKRQTFASAFRENFKPTGTDVACFFAALLIPVGVYIWTVIF